MANTVKINLMILSETSRKLDQIASETFLRSRSNVIDWAVDELFKKLHQEKPAEGTPEPESEAALLMERE